MLQGRSLLMSEYAQHLTKNVNGCVEKKQVIQKNFGKRAGYEYATAVFEEVSLAVDTTYVVRSDKIVECFLFAQQVPCAYSSVGRAHDF